MTAPSRRTAAAATLLAPALIVAGCAFGAPEPPAVPAPSLSPTPAGPEDPAAALIGPPETVVTGLEVPWGVAFLPDGTALVTERDSGHVLHVDPGDLGDPGLPAVREVATVAVDPTGQGGLLGIAVAPEQPADLEFFVYYSTAEDNRVGRLALDPERSGAPSEDLTPVLTGIPKADRHNGGALGFGPDGHLYVGTGDADDPEAATDPESLAGKLLRITPDGDPAPGNPSDSPVWAAGFRDLQGLAWDDTGRLWAADPGPDNDELKLVEPDGDAADPQLAWPEAGCGGLAVTGTVLVAACLDGRSLLLMELTGSGSVFGRERAALVDEYGRLRTPVRAPDGSIWVTTSNLEADLADEPHPDDDRIIRLNVSGDGGAGRT